MSQFPSSKAGAGTTMGIGILSSLFAGLGQRQQGQQEQAAYDYNAQVDLDNAASDMVATQQQYSQLVGRQATAYASAGVDITRGSPLLMMAATAGRGAAQEALIREQGTEKANLQRYYGRLAAYRGTMAGVGTFLNGLSTSAAQFAKQYPSTSGSNVPTDFSGVG